MRESITMFLAVVLCFLLCHPLKSIRTTLASSIYPLQMATKAISYFSPVLSIHFRFEGNHKNHKDSNQLHLIEEPTTKRFYIDWSNFTYKKVTIMLYDAAGKFIGQFDDQSKLAPNNTFFNKQDFIKLSPGIYYAYAQCSTGINTQNGYAKFVVK